MGRANFKFAGAVALVLAVATVLVAWEYHLPIRDPDGVAVPTYVRFPVILLLGFLADVVPRAVWRVRHTPTRVLHSCVAVVRERWPWSHVYFMLAGLGTWYLSYAAFRNLKSYVPFVNASLWDNTLRHADRVFFLGHDPAVLLHGIFGTGWAAHFFSTVYVAWIVMVPVTLAVALVWTRHVHAGAWYVTAVAVDWALGVATYFLMPTLGPVYSRPGDFTDLPHTYVTSLQDSMFQDRLDVLANPFSTHAVQSIAAFASLHVGIMVTVCLMTGLLGLPRWVRRSAWVFLGLTEIATVYLGWHFFVDTLGGVVIGSLAVWISAMGTGHHVGLMPQLRTDEEPLGAPPPQPVPADPRRASASRSA